MYTWTTWPTIINNHNDSLFFSSENRPKVMYFGRRVRFFKTLKWLLYVGHCIVFYFIAFVCIVASITCYQSASMPVYFAQFMYLRTYECTSICTYNFFCFLFHVGCKRWSTDEDYDDSKVSLHFIFHCYIVPIWPLILRKDEQMLLNMTSYHKSVNRQKARSVKTSSWPHLRVITTPLGGEWAITVKK